jgi:uncharacterized membrane protein
MSLHLQEHIEKDGFRLRGLEMSRIDGFSDVVFGFALTLLVVSLEVPKTYSQLHASLRGFFPFAVSFLFLMLVWMAHYKYFRRFGTHDLGTIAINAALLFVVLFYVYPLKFLFTFLFDGLTGSAQGYFENQQQVRELMILYGVGFATIYFLIAALYWNGLRQRVHLELTSMEVMLTKTYIGVAAGVAVIGLLSCITTMILPAELIALSGWVYTLIFFFRWFYGRWTRKKLARQLAFEKLTATSH